jgi:hypothetical protein
MWPWHNRRAMKLAAATVAKTAEKLWKDMGVLSLTFFAYTRMDGKFVVEMYVHFLFVPGWSNIV